MDFSELYEKAVDLFQEHPEAQQVIVAVTADKKAHCFFNKNIIEQDYSQEEDFVNMLVKNGEREITHLLCMWDNYTLDVPSVHLREKLKVHSLISSTLCIILKNGMDFVTKKL